MKLQSSRSEEVDLRLSQSEDIDVRGEVSQVKRVSVQIFSIVVSLTYFQKNGLLSLLALQILDTIN